ncbi:hypothetical protein Xcel_3443 (plasmid) [Xylanimonas cellulosilytica DSM 15894]|uniref:Uncharacterized protein n=1 Tax=Xylanimonas cellulosilytica (strain DSM 15894 / JCM 12276 / CECT 5975 / KCTC 9989 / LMG 20990 / NBRC 107835 / XIL07) TaxID=446471 RepID=D1C0X6_XYLCX|nr:hypothetical protein [Xylanimonas cellulosilytica]ACZ32442.1 hypothetical protein Xcel_3443 [Xylanimonas cellulosilytica DSM 15894]
MATRSGPGASFGDFRRDRDLMNELEPLLADEGVDLTSGVLPDSATLQPALERVVARRNLETFTPVGDARDATILILRMTVGLLLRGDVLRAFMELDELVDAESTDSSRATVAGTTGVALGRLDEVLSGRDGTAPAGPAEHAGTAILRLAKKGRAFSALPTLIGSHGGLAVQRAALITLGAAAVAWYDLTDLGPDVVVESLVR